MAKRPFYENISDSNKRQKSGTIKSFIIRNDYDPHVYINCDHEFVKIGNFVYKTKENNIIDTAIESDFIAINETQYTDIKQYFFAGKIYISNFDPTDEYNKICYVRKLTIDVINPTKSNFITSIKSLTKEIKKLLDEHIISIEQNICIFHKGRMLKIYIADIEGFTFGIVNNETNIVINKFSPNITIYNNLKHISNSMLKVIITKCVIVEQSKNKFPIFIDREHMQRYICLAFNKKFINNEFVIYNSDNIEFTFNVKVSNINQNKFENRYLLVKNNTKENIAIESVTDNIIIVDKHHVAIKIGFSILPLKKYNYSYKDNILYANDIIQYIKKEVEFMTHKQNILYRIGSKELVLHVNYITPNSDTQTMYTIDENTKIIFEKEKSNFVLINNLIPVPIKSITFKILSTNIVTGNKKITFDTAKLKKMIRNIFPIETAVGLQMKMLCNGNECMVRVIKIDCEKVGQYANLGMVVEDTVINFVLAKSNKNIVLIGVENQELGNNLIVELEKVLGGMDDEIKKMVSEICLSRGKTRKVFMERGLEQQKGVLIHGPPGTGKTTLARNISRLLGCDKDKVKMVSGPEIFAKFVGESEENVRDLFKKPKKAWKKFGHASPLFVVIIDEVDAILPKRSEHSANPVLNLVVNQFLAEMDGLIEFHNCICIGTTNRIELLDPAAIRPKRFGCHIKIDLPNKTSREKIFNIYAKKLELSTALDLTMIDINKIINATNDFSGADIEYICYQANLYSIERLYYLENIDEAAINTIGKITQADFEKAIDTILKTRGTSNQIIQSMYS